MIEWKPEAIMIFDDVVKMSPSTYQYLIDRLEASESKIDYPHEEIAEMQSKLEAAEQHVKIVNESNEELIGIAARSEGFVKKAQAKLEAAEQTIDQQRMQLAACSTVAYANTKKAAKATRNMHPDYRCAAVDDVCLAVDREMKLLQTIKDVSDFFPVCGDRQCGKNYEHVQAILNRSKS